MNNLIIRTISGAVFVILVIGSILLHPLAFAFLFFIIALIGLHEFLTIVSADEEKPFGVIPYLLGSYLFLSFTVFAHDLLAPVNLLLILLNIPLLGLMFILELYTGHEKPFTRVAKAITGILYVCLPLALLNFLYYPTLLEPKPEPVILVSMFALIWINDTFAYLTGMLIGKHKLFPSISPKKTWEGSIGGAVFSLLTAILLAQFFPILNTVHWIIFAVVAVVFGSLGDLVESMLKRSYQVKDSGNIMPGHGGVLDRFDATLGVAPVVFFMLLVISLL